MAECWKQPGDPWYVSLLAAGGCIVVMGLTAPLRELNHIESALDNVFSQLDILFHFGQCASITCRVYFSCS